MREAQFRQELEATYRRIEELESREDSLIDVLRCTQADCGQLRRTSTLTEEQSTLISQKYERAAARWKV